MSIISTSKRFGVIGYGSWATTLVGRLAGAGNDILWHVTNEEVFDGICRTGSNPKYVPDMELDLDRIRLSRDIDEVVGSSDVIVLCTPSAFLKSVLSALTVSLKGKFVVSAIKGIVPDECKTVLDYVHDRFDVPFAMMGLLSGPTHAEEVSRGRLSFMTAACMSIDDAKALAACLEGDSFHIDTSTDVLGIEYGAVMKNIYAIASGLAAGLGYGDNFLAVLISRCAREMKSFLEQKVPADGRHISDRAYLADLLVTCYSSYSRNRRLGLLIGRGCSVKSALNEMTMIAEGYYAVKCIRDIAATSGISLPIVEMVYSVLYGGVRARQAMSALSAIL